jgi:cyclohexa-1,5-dienecarbonyl-CoA hydratase
MSYDFPDTKVRVEVLEEGALWHVFLDAPKANVVDAEMTASLDKVFDLTGGAHELKAVLIEGTGDHFSFGASVEEHLPEQVGAMLGGFHNLFRRMEASAVPCIAVVRGQCLGGVIRIFQQFRQSPGILRREGDEQVITHRLLRPCGEQ